MKPFRSLYARIIIWGFLNLAIVAMLLSVFFALQFQLDLRDLMGRKTTDRLRIAGRHISHDLDRSPPANWMAVLVRHAEIYQVDFALVLKNKMIITSKAMTIPEDVMAKVRRGLFFKRPFKLQQDAPEKERWRPSVSMLQEGQPGTGPMFPPEQALRQDRSSLTRKTYSPQRRLVMRTSNPTRYWAGTRIKLTLPPGRPPQPAILLAVSDTLTGNGFFIDPVPWILATGTVILISVLWWFPLVRNITRPLGRMTRATEEIAKGRFDVTIDETRTDEIGRLGSAINHMTARLAGFVSGQKRFLGDVAHELGSPIARIQFGLGVLDQRIDADNQERVADVMEDVAHMSGLVNELLSFSRAEINPGRVKPTATELLALVERVVQRETSPPEQIDIQIQPGLQVMADPELLSRALSNLVRNAVRYAGSAGPIAITARIQKEQAYIEVRDSGPGVPAEMLDQLFEPFYRPEPSRDRQSGGVGLGLAIVQTCIQACNGHVAARNLEPTGFAVTLKLKTPLVST